MGGLRERNKARRREGILDAALALLRFHDIRNVTIEQIAAGAEVSPPTIYNLVGTREQLLVALVDRVVEGLVESLPNETAEDDPIAVARFSVEQSTAAFVADSDAYRQIVRSLGDLAVSGSSFAFEPARVQVRAMKRAQEMGIIREDLDAVGLGRQVFLTYIAALFAWAGEDLSDRGFGIAARHGLATVLDASATDEHRGTYLAELAELGPKLARISWHRR